VTEPEPIAEAVQENLEKTEERIEEVRK